MVNGAFNDKFSTCPAGQAKRTLVYSTLERTREKRLIGEQEWLELSTSSLKHMEETAAKMRNLIVSMPPRDLLGYIYSQHLLKALGDQRQSASDDDGRGQKDVIGESQFLLEYIHAVLASDAEPETMAFDEGKCGELLILSEELRKSALQFAMASAATTKNGIFGPNTAEIEMRAKSSWVLLRGNRYQVLEGEFYRYVLKPHSDVLKEVYGVSSEEIAEGFQAMANATQSGQASAIALMHDQFAEVQALADDGKISLEEATESWLATNSEKAKAFAAATDDLLRGGIANVSRHTNLPSTLLSDLAYTRGEELEFFAAGDLSGTPFRTLPVRKKPLINLGGEYYAVDPCFTRDSGYRALLHNLLQRRPDYKKTFETRQKKMSEGAFAELLQQQFAGARIFNEVYYRDPVTKQWSENDTLILIDDVLLLVEAKAGAAATIASPELDFGRHAQSVQDLVLKAFRQCERFFEYLATAEEVSLYQLIDGKYKECARIKSSDYRVMLPVGLTVESFSPFSAYCKDLPEVTLILGRHAFISLSIDDLFVLRRFLKTAGELCHYMEVRQAVAGMRRVHLFDELDHLGAYLKTNRFDLDLADQLRKEKASVVFWDGACDIVDQSFEGEDWENRPLPSQPFPEELLRLISAIDASRAAKWLLVESYIRNLGVEARNHLANSLSELRKSLSQHPSRYFTLLGEGEAIFSWIQSCDVATDWEEVNVKASAAALASKVRVMIGLYAEIDSKGEYQCAQFFSVHIPSGRSVANARIYEEAERMALPMRRIRVDKKEIAKPTARTAKPGRNEPCPCGSGIKFKRCHGA